MNKYVVVFRADGKLVYLATVSGVMGWATAEEYPENPALLLDGPDEIPSDRPIPLCDDEIVGLEEFEMMVMQLQMGMEV